MAVWGCVPPCAVLCYEAQGIGGEQDGPSKYPPGGHALLGAQTKLAEFKEGTHGALGEHRAG